MKFLKQWLVYKQENTIDSMDQDLQKLMQTNIGYNQAVLIDRILEKRGTIFLLLAILYLFIGIVLGASICKGLI